MEPAADLMPLLQSLQDQQAVLQEAVMQMLEQFVKPNADEGVKFESGMRERMNAILPEFPNARSEGEMTLLLAALLASAGRQQKT